ncbi:hypothetical protein [Longirhabdus pacifica]|uniref:hypothetical protein n=1 Tax=Longirhabdus pacifica TaxID=2305227 RepID=UPI001008D9BC|nr:hypothetical protein [Longirhabdus pacifica]
MGKWKTAAITTMISMALIGCTAEDNAIKTNEEETVVAIDRELPAQEDMTEQGCQKNLTAEQEAELLTITLDHEPLIQTPAFTSAVVGYGETTYTLQFAEEMDKDSVEKALQNNVENVNSISFVWNDDQALKVTVDVTEKEEWHAYEDVYAINVKGACTMQGSELQSPPSIYVSVQEATQISRISVDGSSTEALTDWQEPYIGAVQVDDQHMLLKKYSERTCYACDGVFKQLGDLYNIEDDSVIPYHTDLTVLYEGEGDFYLNPIGFFFSANAVTTDDLLENTINIKVDGYVHGAMISQDQNVVMMAVGDTYEDQENLDFVLFNVTTNEYTKFEQALQGVLINTTALNPVIFLDNGEYVYTSMYDTGEVNHYRYSWQDGEFNEWQPESEELTTDFYVPYWSEDGVFAWHYGQGLYEGDKRVAEYDPEQYHIESVHWIGNTHQLVYLKKEEDDIKLVQLNADTLQETVIKEDVTGNTSIVGVSDDGKWIYISHS